MKSSLSWPGRARRRPSSMPASPAAAPGLVPVTARALALAAAPLAVLALAVSVARAAEPATGAGPAAGTAPAPDRVALAPGADPMTHLKQRLQETLGARLADDARGTHELQVPARKPAPAKVAVAVPARGGSGAAAASGRPEALPWGYEGETGPAHWARLDPAYALCGAGERQSPIDLRDGIAVDLHPIAFDYRPSRFTVIDNGRTVQVDVAPGSGIEVSGRRYELQHFVFRRPSEARIEGRQFEMSVQLVHRAVDGRLAIVAVVLERGPALPVVQQVWNDLPLERHVPAPGMGELDPAGLLPADRRYYTYMGSLTTPPCTEGVLWMVMQQPVTASAQQMDIFGRLYPMNARPVQAVAGRLIKQSN